MWERLSCSDWTPQPPPHSSPTQHFELNKSRRHLRSRRTNIIKHLISLQTWSSRDFLFWRSLEAHFSESWSWTSESCSWSSIWWQDATDGYKTENHTSNEAKQGKTKIYKWYWGYPGSQDTWEHKRLAYIIIYLLLHIKLECRFLPHNSQPF